MKRNKEKNSISNLGVLIKKCSIVIVLFMLVFMNTAEASIYQGKYGKAQAFDCMRTPPLPTVGNPFQLWGFNNIYDATSLDLYSNTEVYWGASNDRYIMFEGANLELKLYEANGTYVKTISNSGKIYGLDAKGFLYVSDARNYGYFISNVQGFSYGGGITYTPSIRLATQEQLDQYNATQQVLGIGETTFPTITDFSGMPTTGYKKQGDIITLSTTASDPNGDTITYIYEYFNGSSWSQLYSGVQSTYEHTLPYGNYTGAMYRVKVSDGTGESAYTTQTGSFGLDSTNPIISATLNPSGWTNINVLIDITATDAASGIQSATSDITAMINGTYIFTATDVVGNSVSNSIEVTNIDKLNPNTPTIVKVGPYSKFTLTDNDDADANEIYGKSGIAQLQFSIDDEAHYTQYTGQVDIEELGKSAGDYTVYARALDNAGNYSTSTSTTIHVNAAPIANDDIVTMYEDTVAEDIDVLINDTDAENSTLTITEKTNGSHGTVTITNAGLNLTYTPDADYNGTDSFTYTISDGYKTDTATVNVTIYEVDDIPRDITLSDTEVRESVVAGTFIADVQVVDPDKGNGDTFTFSLVNGYGDNDKISIEEVNSDTARIKTLAIPDHETDGSYDIKISVIDTKPGTTSYEKTFSIDITDGIEIPEITALTPKGDGSVELTINKYGNVDTTEYYLEQADDANFTQNVITHKSWETFGAGVNTFNIGTGELSTDKTFYYRIKAKYADGIEVPYGETKSVLTMLPIPSQPTLVVNSDTQITVNWDAVTKNETSTVMYDLYANGNLVEASLESISYTHTGLIPNTSYTYTVKARNASGASEHSVSREDATLAIVPDVDEVKPEANGSITMAIEEYNNSAITEYYIEKATTILFTDVSLAHTWVNPAVDSKVNVTGLDRGKTYYFRVKARNQKNIETVCGDIIGSIITIPADMTVAPEVTILSDSQLSLSWNSITGATSYDVYRNGSLLKNIVGTSTTDLNLDANTLYRYEIKGKNSSGESVGFSPESIVKYTYAKVPSITGIPNVNGVEIDLNVDANDNPANTEYQVDYATANDFSGAITVAWTTTKSQNISGLTNGVKYYFRVKARNGNAGANTTNETEWSQIFEVVMPLSQVQNLTAVVTSESQIDLSWDTIVNASQYKIYRDGVLIGTSNVNTYSDTGLLANKEYAYKISAINSTNLEAEKSIEVAKRTLAIYPTKVTVMDKSKTSVSLEITPDKNLGDNEKYRVVLKNKANGSTVLSLAYSPDLIYNIKGLNNTIEYEVWVGVKNNDGEIKEPIKYIHSMYINRDLVATITNNENILKSDLAGYNSNFEIKLKVNDVDGDKITATATVAGITITKTVENQVEVPAEANMIFSWDILSIPEGTHTNIDIELVDEYNSTITKTFTANLIIDRTAPIITLNSNDIIYLEQNDVYTDAGATVTGDDGNGIVTTGDVVDTAILGEHIVTYESTDNVGNKTTKTRKVIVVKPIAIDEAKFSIDDADLVRVVDEDEGTVTITVNRSVDTVGVMTLNYRTVAKTAIAVVDYTDISGILTFADGETTKTLTVEIVDDGNYEKDEEFVIEISSPSAGNVVESKSKAIIKIRDNDIANNQNSISIFTLLGANGVVNDGEGTINIEVPAISDITNVSPSDITVSAGATVTPALNVARDFTNKIAYTVTAEDGTEKRYIVTVTKAGALASDADLTGLIIKKTSDDSVITYLPAFNSAQTEGYATSVINEIDKIKLENILSDANASFKVYVNNVEDSTPESIDLVVGENEIKIEVTAENGITVKTYKLRVVRNVAVGLSNNNYLSNIVVNGLTLSPTFSKEEDEYKITAENAKATTNVTVVSESTKSSTIISANGATVVAGTDFNLNVGSNTVTITVTAENSTVRKYFIAITRKEVTNPSTPVSGGSSGGGGSGSSNKATIGTEGTTGGSIGTVETKKKDGVEETTFKLKETSVRQVIKELKEDSNGKKEFNITASTNSNTVKSELTGQTVKDMEKGKVTLKIETRDTVYTIPAEEIDIDNISKKIGTQVKLSDIGVEVKIQEVSKMRIEEIKEQNKEKTYKIVAPIVNFEIEATHGNKKVKVSKFKSYVEREIKLPEGIDPTKVTTGVVIDDKGIMSHIPTIIIKRDGKHYAKINSLTNSTYSVIYNKVTFKDVEDHWAKDSVNDMGSRLIIAGRDAKTFDPQAEITRAEFASIVVKGLGLMRAGTGVDSYKDVATADWYYDTVSIASEYGIIKGYEDETFGANNKITREEAMVMMMRAMKIANVDITVTNVDEILSRFEDNKDIKDWAKESVAACVKQELANGSFGKLWVDNNITRAETATIVERMLQNTGLINR